MTAGFEISQLKGTPLYALAKNANVYGGKTLSKTEMVFFQQQCKEMGFSPEKYGLEIASEDIEGENFKETKKNLEKLTDSINDAYKSKIKKKNNAVETAKSAETKAYAIINTAKEGFVRSHGDNSGFIPENLGQRPNFMAPEYKDNLTKYVSDLNGWAQKVSEQYRSAESKTNEELAAMIMTNSNSNAAINAGITQGVGAAIMANDDKNAEGINANIDQSAKNINANVDKRSREIKGTVREEASRTRKHVDKAVGEMGDILGRMILTESDNIQQVVKKEGDNTRQLVADKAKDIKETVETSAKETQEIGGLSSKVSGVLTSRKHPTKAVKKVNTMKNTIISSDLPQEKKKELLDDLADFSDQGILSNKELEQKSREIDDEIASARTIEKQPASPISNEPIFPIGEWPISPIPISDDGPISPIEEKPIPSKGEEPFVPIEERPHPSGTRPLPDIPATIKNNPKSVEKIINPKKTIEEQKPDIQDKTILDMPKKDDIFDKFKK